MALPTDKVEYRAVICFPHVKWNNAANIHAEMVDVYSNNVSSHDTMVR